MKKLGSMALATCSLLSLGGLVLMAGEGDASEKAPATHEAPAAHAAPAATPETAAAPVAAAPVTTLVRPSSKGCLADNLAIEDIRRQRDELDARVKQLTAKEAELKAKEVALEEELKKLELVRDEIKQADAQNKKQDEEKVAKLVETFETMSPKSASNVLSQIDENLAVVAIARISTQRLAKIMGAMDPAKASRLTELLAGVARSKKQAPATVAGDALSATNRNNYNQSKGGNKYDGTNEQQAITSPEAAAGTSQQQQREPASQVGAGAEKGKH